MSFFCGGVFAAGDRQILSSGRELSIGLSFLLVKMKSDGRITICAEKFFEGAKLGERNFLEQESYNEVRSKKDLANRMRITKICALITNLSPFAAPDPSSS
jgi:hypothetical protein